jgi:imidazolonepropionase-like amidohydrolase
MKQCFLFAFFIFPFLAFAQNDSFYLLKPDRVFDGETMHSGWVVLVHNNKIEQAGDMNFKLPANTRVINLKGATLLPGLIEGHAHLFLHPYNEVSWNDQVLKESRAERTARAVVHADSTLLAGFTTVRDLGTEGAMYDDVGLKTAIEKGIVPGPRMIVSTRAIVARGAYGPQYDNADLNLPQGAAEVGNREELENEIRIQISKGADFIKIYADYGIGKNGKVVPTFSVDELKAAVALAKNSGRQIVIHATTPEGMRRGIEAGVATIEHGDNGTEEIFRQMKEKGIALCPTLAAGDAYRQYDGWRKGIDPEPESIKNKKNSFAAALRSGVTICMGGDVGVYTHGDNAREMEMMVDYGMKPIDVLKSATSVNADAFGYSEDIGRIKKNLRADIIAVASDPSTDIKSIRKIIFIMKNGKIYKEVQ